jgi:RNA polymerase sigma factor (sigma-70 family)
MGSQQEGLPERIARGEEAAFTEFSQRYQRAFYSYFRHRGLHDAAARDLTCNCLTDILLKVRSHFTLGTNFDAWAFTLVRNAAISWLRREKRFETTPLPPDIRDPQKITSAPPPNVALVKDAIEQLDRIDREIIYLRYNGFETPSFLAIAAELSIKLGLDLKEATVRQRHARALKKLTTLLSEPDPEV